MLESAQKRARRPCWHLAHLRGRRQRVPVAPGLQTSGRRASVQWKRLEERANREEAKEEEEAEREAQDLDSPT